MILYIQIYHCQDNIYMLWKSKKYSTQQNGYLRIEKYKWNDLAVTYLKDKNQKITSKFLFTMLNILKILNGEQKK